MSTIDSFILLAKYNQLMNQRQYAAAATLPLTELQADKGAFFKSILGTLNHILIGDIIWLKRFAQHPSSEKALAPVTQFQQPKSLNDTIFTDLNKLRVEREKLDQVIVEWVSQLTDCDLEKCITYSNMAGESFSKNYQSLIHHLFLHQVHHRGQITTLLSQCGVDFGETDLIEIIDHCDI